LLTVTLVNPANLRSLLVGLMFPLLLLPLACGRTDLSIDDEIEGGAPGDSSVLDVAHVDARSDTNLMDVGQEDVEVDADAGCDKQCGGHCVSNDDPQYGCASTGCAPCDLAHASPTCSSGVCAIGACDKGWGDCDQQPADGCEVDLTSTHEHCGSCPNACGSTLVCLQGSCQPNCGALTDCNGSCVDLSTNPAHCSSCAHSCTVPSHGKATCAAGQCGSTCDTGYHACGGQCDDDTSVNSCGTSCTPCPAPPPNGVATCSAGQCGFGCDTGYHACGNQCDDSTSVNSCGALCTPCPVPANGTTSCAAGQCTIACNLGYVVCGNSCCSCGNIQNDPHNCGYCGHDCQGAACVAGVCQSTIVASQQTDAWAIAVDETNVYWTTYGPNGSIMKAPLATGNPVPLATGQYPAAITIDGTAVYWANYGGLQGGIMSVPIAGGSPKPLATTLDTPTAIAVAGNTVLWTAYPYMALANGVVASVPTGGGATTTIAQNQYEPTGVSVSPTKAFWTSSYGVFAAPLPNGQQTTVSPSYGFGVTVDATNIYWTTWNNVMQAPLTGKGGPITLASGLYGTGAIQVDATSVYFLIEEGGTGGVYKVPIGGGSLIPLATMQSDPNGLAVNSTRVFWANFGDGTIRSVPK
jgi:hypothetical protein